MSLLLLFNNHARQAVQTLAAPEVSDDDLRRLTEVLEEARNRDASLPVVTAAIEREVPRAAAIAPLLQQGGQPLATWLAVILAAIALLLSLREKEPVPPTLTPEQLQEIVERAINEGRQPTEPKPVPDPQQPQSGDQERSQRLERGGQS